MDREGPARCVASSSFGGTSFATRSCSMCRTGWRRDFKASKGDRFRVTEDPLDLDACGSTSDSASDSGPESVRLRAWLGSPFRKSLVRWEKSE